MRVGVIAALIVAVLGVNLTIVAAGLLGDEAGAHALVPADAVAFVHVTLDPSVDQKLALASLAQGLPDDAPEKIERAVVDALDSAFLEVDLDYEADVKPWLGGEAALFVGGDLAAQPQGALLLETTDATASTDAARRALTAEGGEIVEESYRGHTYSVVRSPRGSDLGEDAAFGVIDGFLLVGTPEAMASAIDAGAAGGIEANPDYRNLVGTLATDRLVTSWIDVPAIVESFRAGLPPGEADRLANPAFAPQQAGAILATTDSIVFETAMTKPGDNAALLQSAPADANLMGSLPADALLAVVLPQLGDIGRAALDAVPEASGVEQQFTQATGLNLRKDLLAWMGDGALFVRGETLDQLSGALIIQSDDADATRRALRRLASAATPLGLNVKPVRTGSLAGYELADPAAPAAVTVVGGDRLVIAVDRLRMSPGSPALDALTAGSTLADSETFTRATASLGDGYAPALFLDVGRTYGLVRSTFGQSSTPPELTEAERYIDRISHVIAGVRVDGPVMMQRVVIGTSAP